MKKFLTASAITAAMAMVLAGCTSTENSNSMMSTTSDEVLTSSSEMMNSSSEMDESSELDDSSSEMDTSGEENSAAS